MLTPEPGGGGVVNTAMHLRGLGESQYGRLERKLSALSTVYSVPKLNSVDLLMGEINRNDPTSFRTKKRYYWVRIYS